MLNTYDLGTWKQRATKLVVDDWCKRISGIFDEMETLTEGWDGYGGAAPDSDHIACARGLLELLAKCYPALPAPFLVPTHDGKVLIEWETGPFQLELITQSVWGLSFCHFNTETNEADVGILFSHEPLGESKNGVAFLAHLNRHMPV